MCPYAHVRSRRRAAWCKSVVMLADVLPRILRSEFVSDPCETVYAPSCICHVVHYIPCELSWCPCYVYSCAEKVKRVAPCHRGPCHVVSSPPPALCSRQRESAAGPKRSATVSSHFTLSLRVLVDKMLQCNVRLPVRADPRPTSCGASSPTPPRCPLCTWPLLPPPHLHFLAPPSLPSSLPPCTLGPQLGHTLTPVCQELHARFRAGPASLHRCERLGTPRTHTRHARNNAHPA
jgi:hypothetical protein